MWERQHYRLSLGSTIRSKTEAKAEADRVRAEIRAGRFGPQASAAPVTLGQLMGVYFERYVRVHRARVSNEEYNRNVILRTEVPTVEGTLRPFTDWPIRDISADTQEHQVAVDRDLMLLRSCFNWAIHPGGDLTLTPFKIGPVTAVRLFPEVPRDRRLEPGEAERLLPACGSDLRALVEGALETVCRVGELLSLQWRAVRWAQNEIILPATKTKARRVRDVPISPRLHAVLEMRRLDPDR